MKHYLRHTLFLLILFSFSQMYGQSFQGSVFLKSGQEIKGRILEMITDDYVKIQTKNNEIRVFSFEEVSKITKKLISEEKSRYIEDEKEIEEDDSLVSFFEQQSQEKVRVTIGGGYSHWTGESMDVDSHQEKEFLSGLRKGYNVDLEVQFFFKNKDIGVALNSQFIHQSNTAEGSMNISGLGQVSNYKESHRYIYVGPSFTGRYQKNKWGLYYSLGLGAVFVSYSSGQTINNVNKTALALYYGLSGEYKIAPNAGLGLKLSSTLGSIKVDNFSNDRLSVSHWSIGLFMSFVSR